MIVRLLLVIVVALSSSVRALKFECSLFTYDFKLHDELSNNRPVFKSESGAYLYSVELPKENSRWLISDTLGSESGRAFLNSWAEVPWHAAEVSSHASWSVWNGAEWVIEEPKLTLPDDWDSSFYVHVSGRRSALAGLYVRTGIRSNGRRVWFNPHKKVYVFYLTENGLTRWMFSHELGSLSGVGFVDINIDFPNDLSLPDYAGRFMVPKKSKWAKDSDIKVIASRRPSTIFEAIRDELRLQPDEATDIERTMFKASNGMRIPYIGYGTGAMDPSIAEESIATALDVGYRALDLAIAYQNEDMVGELIARDTTPARESLYLISKIWPTNFGFAETIADVHNSLGKLRTNYIDAFLLHWPRCLENVEWMDCGAGTGNNYISSWRALERLYAEAVLLNIGVSNFNRDDLRELHKNARQLPHIVQNWADLTNDDGDVRAYCNENGVFYQAYSPLRSFNAPPEQLSVSYAAAWRQADIIGKRYHKEAREVMLRWLVENRAGAVPRSSRVEHMRANLAVTSWRLDEVHLRSLNEFAATGVIASAGKSGGDEKVQTTKTSTRAYSEEDERELRRKAAEQADRLRVEAERDEKLRLAKLKRERAAAGIVDDVSDEELAAKQAQLDREEREERERELAKREAAARARLESPTAIFGLHFPEAAGFTNDTSTVPYIILAVIGAIGLLLLLLSSTKPSTKKAKAY